jgi:DNA-binding Lrp family transcriptional regulator
VFELEGEFDFGVVLTVHDILDSYHFLAEMSVLAHFATGRKAFGARVGTCLFQRRYLAASIAPAESISYRLQTSKAPPPAGVIDYRILAGLFTHRGVSQRELARRLQLPASTVTDRIQRMERDRILLGYAFGMNTEWFGIRSYRILLSTRKNDQATWESLVGFCRRAKNVVCLIQCVGIWDFELHVETERSEEVGRVANALRQHLADGLLDLRRLSVTEFLKASSYPFTQTPDEP